MPNHRMEENRQMSRRFVLAWGGDPGHRDVERIEGRSSHPRRWPREE